MVPVYVLVGGPGARLEGALGALGEAAAGPGRLLWRRQGAAPAVEGWAVVEGAGAGCGCCEARGALRGAVAGALEGAGVVVVACEEAEAPLGVLQGFLAPLEGARFCGVVSVWGAGRLEEVGAEVRRWEALGHGGEVGREWVAEGALAWAEVADVIVGVGEAEARWLRALNPEAALARGAGQVAAEAASPGAAMQRPGWVRALRGDENIEPWRVFSARRPFHPGRLRAVMEARWPGLVRARGFVWLATQMKFVTQWSASGAAWSLKASGVWWAELPEERRPRGGAMGAKLEAQWVEPWGDRRQEVAVLCGEEGREALWEALEGALLDDEEMGLGQVGWRFLNDPLRGIEARGLSEGPLRAAGPDLAPKPRSLEEARDEA